MDFDRKVDETIKPIIIDCINENATVKITNKIRQEKEMKKNILRIKYIRQEIWNYRDEILLNFICKSISIMLVCKVY